MIEVETEQNVEGSKKNIQKKESMSQLHSDVVTPTENK